MWDDNGDNNYNITTTAPLGTICVFNDDYEYKHFESICFTNGTNTYYKYVCLPILNGVEQTEIIIWKDEEGNTIPEPSDVLTLCSDIEICEPVIEDFLGNNAPDIQFDSIQVIIPKCCEIVITTSAGTITIPAQESKFVFNKSFDCLITGYQINGNCVDKVYTILTKSK